MVFYNGLYFALRSRKEHRQLCSDPCQISLVEQPGEQHYVKYVEHLEEQVNEKSCRLRMGVYRYGVKRKGDKIGMGL